MRTQAQNAPFQFESTITGLRVTIPRRRGGVLLFVTVVNLAILIFFAYMNYRSIANALAIDGPPLVVKVVPVLFFTFGSYTLAKMLLCFRGRNETITVNSGSLEYKMKIFGFGRTRAYRCSAVRDLRLAAFLARDPVRGRGLDLQPLGTNRGFVAFDYEGQTVRLAPALGEESAAQLLRQLAAYLPPE